MFHVPEYLHSVSMALSSVLRDIGLNERTVSIRRRTQLLGENLLTVTDRLRGLNMSIHYFGSQSEGTTTKGLESDVDVLSCCREMNVIEDLEDWKADISNLRMIQGEAPPGYCMLQSLHSNACRPVTKAETGDFVKIGEDMVVMKNSYFDEFMYQEEVRNGAAMTSQEEGFYDVDNVSVFQCKVLPHRVRTWIRSQMDNGTISREMKQYMENNPCYVVPVSSKGSQHEVLEWRISTSHIERCLMFNLNVTQIQCYVMMKIILKSYLAHPHKMLSSFMCKNILLLCLEKAGTREWRSCSLLKMLSFCLHHLKLCVIHKTCPHFLIRENNLLLQKITTVDAHSWLYNRVKLVLQCTDVLPLFLKIDDIGRRLQMKLNLRNGLIYNFISAQEISQDISAGLINSMSGDVSDCHKCILNHCLLQDDVLQSLYQALVKLHYRKCHFQRLACAPVKHLLYSNVGCTIASTCIQQEYSVSHEALIWLRAGINSDVSSGRLKMASVFYCSGDLDTVCYILGDIEQRYKMWVVASKCFCYNFPGFVHTRHFSDYVDRHDECPLGNTIAFCVRFQKSEMYCVPKELRYEMFRSIHEEIIHRDEDDDCWMDWAVVDSLPYLYFLQYKTYNLYGRYADKQRALVNLSSVVSKQNENFGHRETSWNLLGQCFEQENRLVEAFQCYRESLSIRPDNNAARIHIIKLLIRRRREQRNA